MSLGRVVLIWSLLIVTSGCSQRELVNKLDQRQSTEVLVVLSRAGVPASRTEVGGGKSSTYSITVDPEYFSRGLEVIHEYGLPRSADQEIERTLEQNGFVPNPKEITDLRLDRALGLQVERSLRSLPGVVDAWVNIRTRSGREAILASPRAWIHLRYSSASGNEPFSVDEVKKVVISAVPEMRAEDVELKTSALPPGLVLTGSASILNSSLERLMPFGFRVPESERVTAQRQLASVILLSALCAAIVGLYLGWWMGRSRRKPSAELVPVRNNIV